MTEVFVLTAEMWDESEVMGVFSTLKLAQNFVPGLVFTSDIHTRDDVWYAVENPSGICSWKIQCWPLDGRPDEPEA